ncbi:hypothetical protein C8Q80DRAFT_877003 [Daedaleopsis nitida]|nr:hypothetical protein C8Q80DRAFT_877003 [Daedaleopsis nitida]
MAGRRALEGFWEGSHVRGRFCFPSSRLGLRLQGHAHRSIYPHRPSSLPASASASPPSLSLLRPVLSPSPSEPLPPFSPSRLSPRDDRSPSLPGSAVGLTGLTTPASGTYSVSLDQEQPLVFSARSSFTASSPTLLFFRSGLDPSVMHTLKVVNTGASRAGEGAGSLLVLGAVNVTDAQTLAATPIGAAKGPSLPRGAIAALAIGVILAFGALVAVIVVFVRRRHHNDSRKRQMLVNPQISRARRLSFLFPHKRRDEPVERGTQKARESAYEAGGVLDIRSPTPHAHEKDESDDSDDGEDVETGLRLTAAEKGKQRALRRSNASKNSDGSYSIDFPDLTIAQVPRGYLPASAVPSTPSPPRTLTLIPSPTATSPRSPARPRGPRELPGRESTRGILMTNLGPLPSPAFTDEEGQLIVTAPSYLPETHISPLRVEFASDVQDRFGNGGERSVSMGAMSLPQSLKLALAQPVASESSVSAPPSPTRANRIYSFLDFSSTSTSLTRSQRQSASNSTGKSRSSSRSKRNTGSENSHNRESRRESRGVDWATLPPDRRISLGLSMTLAGGGTTSRPSLSPNVSLHPVPLSHSAPALPALQIGEATPPSQESPEREGPHQEFPYDANQLPSPTDSVPYTVSDIHFRHSTHSSISHIESRRTSAYRLSGSHRPPHPPLPNSPGPSSPTRLTRQVHRRGGSQAGSQSVPPFIVQRILGRAPSSVPGSTYASPTTPQFGSVGSVAGAAMAMRAQTTPSPTPTPRAAAASSQPSAGAQTTPAPTNASGSSSVFGFQLGRHR